MELVATSKAELTESLVTELNALHVRATEIDESIRLRFIEKLALCRRIADLLDTARSEMPAAKFEAFTRKLNFSQPILRSYQTINHRARKQPETALLWRDMASFERARQTAAERPVQKPQRLRDISVIFGDASRCLQRFMIVWTKVINVRPISRWEPEQIEAFCEELKGTIDIYSQLKKELSKHG